MDRSGPVLLDALAFCVVQGVAAAIHEARGLAVVRHMMADGRSALDSVVLVDLLSSSCSYSEHFRCGANDGF